MSKLLTKNRP